MSEKRWLSVHSRENLFGKIEASSHSSRNVTAEDLEEMLANDEPIPEHWYQRTDKGLEISEGFDNVLRAARIMEFETDGKVDWCVLACSVIQEAAASDRPAADNLCYPPFGNRQNETVSDPTLKSADWNNGEDKLGDAIRE